MPQYDDTDEILIVWGNDRGSGPVARIEIKDGATLRQLMDSPGKIKLAVGAEAGQQRPPVQGQDRPLGTGQRRQPWRQRPTQGRRNPHAAGPASE